MNVRRLFSPAFVCTALGFPFIMAAQQPSMMLTGPADAVNSSVSVSAPAPKTSTDSKPLTARWLDLKTFSHAERYRNAFAVGGNHIFDNAQERSLIEGKIKIDAEGRYAIGFRASSGRYFNWAYSSFTGEGAIARVKHPQGGGVYFTPAEGREAAYASLVDPAGLALLDGSLQSNGWEFYMRELYGVATPIKPVTIEFGSFGFERGYGSEITSFDDDGYLSGERLRIHDPKHLFFDEVGYTNAFFGDLATVNLFARGASLTKFNYRQVFAKKRINSRIAISGDYTWQLGTDTLREAAMVHVKELKVIDTLRLEAYERLNTVTFPGQAKSRIGPIPANAVSGASGFAVTLGKSLGRLSGDVGYATIDKDYSIYYGSRFFHAVNFSLNGDSYGAGNRPFVHASYKLPGGVSAFGFYTHEVGAARVLTLNQQGYNAGMNFDFKALANVKKEIF